jgi:hypothetical protein
MNFFLFLPLLLITCLSFAQDAKEIIGNPIKIGNLLVAQNSFSDEMNFEAAKKACRSLGKGWRLPTKSELNFLYKNKIKIGGFVSNYYWSSTEISYKLIDPRMTAWGQDFNSGRWDSSFKHDEYLVRAVRTF